MDQGSHGGWPPHTAGIGLPDLKGAVRFLRRHYRLVLGTTGALMAVTLAALVLVPPRYTATAVVLVDPRQHRIAPAESVLPGIGTDAAAVESQVELIESIALIRGVVERLGLAEDAEFARVSLVDLAIRSVWPKRASSPAQADLIERTTHAVRQNLTVRRRGLTYVLQVDFSSASPTKAARIANAIAEAYLAEQVRARSDATTSAAGWLEERIAEQREKVRAAEEAVARFRAENGIVEAGAGSSLMERQITELNQQLILARARTAEARARFDQIRATARTVAGTSSVPETLQSPVIAGLRAQYAEVVRQQATLGVTHGPRHPEVGVVRAQVARIEAQIEREIERVLGGLRSEYEAAAGRETSLQRSLSALEQKAAGMDQARVRLRELETEAQTNKTVFQQYLSRLKETREQESLRRPDARIVSSAIAPLTPSFPKKGLSLAAAAFVGLGLGTALSLGRDGYGQRRLRTVDQVQALGLPCLALLPTVEPKDLGMPERHARQSPDGETVTERFSKRLASLVVNRPGSRYAEELRGLRMQLGRGPGKGDAPGVVAVTSALSGEGKSTLAVNLALSYARAGYRTLLVDADVLGRGASQLLGLGEAAGVADLFETPDRLDHLVLRGGFPRFDVLPAGCGADPGALDRIGRPTIQRLVQQLRTRYDTVVIDTSPLLSTVYGRAIVPETDAAVLVAAWDSTPIEAVRTALDSLDAGRTSGLVLNKVEPSRYALYAPDYKPRDRSEAAASSARAVA